MAQFARDFSLANGPDTPGLECTPSGVKLAGVPLLKTTGHGFSPRMPNELAALMKAAYGRHSDGAALWRGLDVAARALNDGDLSRAMIAALQLKLPDIHTDGASRMARLNDTFSKYNSEEPRDPRGRWTAEDAADAPGDRSAPTRSSPRNSAGLEQASYAPAAHNHVYPNVTSFRNLHLSEAIKLAALIGHGVTADEVLAVSGAETTYGADAKAKVHGNFFGIHSRGTSPSSYFPGQIGTVPTAKDGPIATFRLDDGFMSSGLIFANRIKAVAEGQDLSDPDRFLVLVHNHGWGVSRKDYLSFARNVYDLLRNSARTSENKM